MVEQPFEQVLPAGYFMDLSGVNHNQFYICSGLPIHILLGLFWICRIGRLTTALRQTLRVPVWCWDVQALIHIHGGPVLEFVAKLFVSAHPATSYPDGGGFCGSR